MGRSIRRRRIAEHRERPVPRWRRRAWAIGSLVAIAGGLAIGANIGWFYWRNHTVGGALLHQEQARIRAADHRANRNAACNNTAPSGGAQGIVQARSIGMDAPVLDGDGNSQLDVAVGHNPASAWPGLTGTVVLSAHDVSWFSQIDHLHPGDTIDYLTPCNTYVYTVAGHQIVHTGAPVAATAQPRLVLVTCYPLDALWVTAQRYLVTADLTSIRHAGATTPLPASTAGAIPTSLPAAVASQAERDVTTTAPLGQLTIEGNPAPSWRQSTEALNAANSALGLYFGALQIAEAGDASEWVQAAPSVAFEAAAPLVGATVSANLRSVTPTLTVAGSTPTAASVTARVALTGGDQPGTYEISMDAVVRGATLTITNWTMTRV